LSKGKLIQEKNPELEMTALKRVQMKIQGWCTGRIWYIRALLLVAFVYIGFRHLVNPHYSSIFGGLNLVIHELGHIIFGFGGQFIMIAGGTILQLAVPLVCAAIFVFQPDYFAVCVCGAWLSTNLYNVAQYVGDARARMLPLVTVGGGDAIHDWHYILSRMHILSWDTRIAGFTRLLAFIIMWSSLVIAAWMLLVMVQSKRKAI
jgi:hypothetical protein